MDYAEAVTAAQMPPGNPTGVLCPCCRRVAEIVITTLFLTGKPTPMIGCPCIPPRYVILWPPTRKEPT